MSDPDLMSATGTAQLVRSGAMSAREVVEHALARIDRMNPLLGAVTFVDAAAACDAADRLDRRIHAGEPVGALAGVPTLVKDLYGFVPGWPSTLGGIPAMRGVRTPEGLWSAFPRAAVAADAILLGLTNSPVFGFRGVTDNAVFGPTRNPFDPDRNAGGSSGGAAAAVAAGMVPVAGASDGGGSIRIPAAWTSTVGFQPSPGRVPSTPRPVGFHLAPHIYEGPISRTVEDAAAVMDVLQSFDPRDPASIDRRQEMTAALSRGIRDLRIGVADDFGGFPVDSAVREAIGVAVRAFDGLARSVEPVRLDLGRPHGELTDAWLRMMGTLMLSDIDGARAQGVDLAGDGGLPEPVVEWVDRAASMTVREVLADRATRTAVMDGLLSALEHVDLLVGPTATALPVPNAADGGTVGPSEVGGISVDPLIGWCPTFLTNFAGLPSITVPAGFVDGLPVGLLIVGRRFHDDEVVAAAAAFERVRPWSDGYRRVVGATA